MSADERTPTDGSMSGGAGARVMHGVPVLESERLFGTHRELIIMRGTDAYRLRITSKGKLILTK